MRVCFVYLVLLSFPLGRIRMKPVLDASDGPSSDKEEGTGSWATCLLMCRIGLCSVFTPNHDMLRAVFVGKQAPALGFPILEIHGHSATAAQSIFIYIVYGTLNNGKSLGPETWKE